MGLKDMTPEQLKAAQDLLMVLEFYGVKEEDIKLIAKIPVLIETINALVEENNRLKIAINRAEAKEVDNTPVGKEIKDYMEYGEGGDH